MRKLMLVAVVGTAFALTACKKEEPAPAATTEAMPEETPMADSTEMSSEAAPESAETSAAAM